MVRKIKIVKSFISSSPDFIEKILN